MRVFALILAAAMTLLLASAPARAEMYLGLTADGQLLGVNIEFAGAVGSAYVVLGAYEANTGYEFENLTAIIGLRRFQGGKYKESSFFGGIFLGDVDGGPSYTRLGAGGEVGYQWVTENLRTTLHAGMALVGEASGEGAPVTSSASASIQPSPLLGASVSLRF